MKKFNKFTMYLVIALLLIVSISVLAVYLDNKANAAKQAQVQSDQAKSDKEKESRKQDLLSQKTSLEKNLNLKKGEGDSYKKLSDTYCGYLNPPEGKILLQTDYQTYFQQCEEYKRKAIDTYTQARSISIELETITNKINTGNY